jgi:hypothetical protein
MTKPLLDQMTDDAMCGAILSGVLLPLDEPYTRGWQDWADGKAFHQGPYDYDSPQALSWRFGWNDHALAAGGANGRSHIN